MTETKTTTRRRTKKTVDKEAAASPSRPGGKLGKIVEHMDSAEGATLAELTALSGWQPHTVRAALTRLRQRGFKICLEERGDRKAYRLDIGNAKR
jgi:hypothetical protein